MSILERIPKYTLNNYNQLRVKAPEVYIDDIFDPLFNKKAKEYLDAKYGWGPIGNTFAGYAEGINNALIGQNDKWGILGPGMGILSGFGRSMDKADDFLIGGLTEGVNLISQGLGNNVVAENPLENIFVNDEDYTGARLLAAMGNTMSKMAGAPTLEESDFKGLWNIPAMGLELATDPGILGGSLAKRFSPDAGKTLKEMPSVDIIRNIGNGQQSPLASVGQLLSNYDDLMSNVAWDLTAPGLRQALSAFQKQISQIISASKESRFKDTILKQSQTPDSEFYTSTGPGTGTQWTTDPNIKMAEQMLDDMYEKYAVVYAQDPFLAQEWTAVKQAAQAEDFEFTLDKANVEATILKLKKETDLHALKYRQHVDNLIKDIYSGYDKAFSDAIDDTTGQILSRAPTIISPTHSTQFESLYDNIARSLNYNEYDMASTYMDIFEDVLNRDEFEILANKYENMPTANFLKVAKQVIDDLESGAYSDSYLADNAILQQYLSTYKNNPKIFTKSPIRAHVEPVHTQANPDLIKGLDRELKLGLLNAHKHSNNTIVTYESLVESIIKDLKSQGIYKHLKSYVPGVFEYVPKTDFRDFLSYMPSKQSSNLKVETKPKRSLNRNVKLSKKEIQRIPGVRPATIPGLDNLLKNNDTMSYNVYLNNVKKFVKIIEDIEKYTSLKEIPQYQSLITMKDRIKTNYLDIMDFKIDNIDMNPVTGLQSILNANPYAFYSVNKKGDYEFDFEKYNHFASSLPYLEIKVPEDVKVPISKIYDKNIVSTLKGYTAFKVVDDFLTKNKYKHSLKKYPQLQEIVGTSSKKSRYYKIYTSLRDSLYEELKTYSKVHPNATYEQLLEHATDTSQKYLKYYESDQYVYGNELYKHLDTKSKYVSDEFKLYNFKNEEFKDYLIKTSISKNIPTDVESKYVSLMAKNPKVVFKNIENVPNEYITIIEKQWQPFISETTAKALQESNFGDVSMNEFRDWIPVFSDNPKRDLRLFDLIQGMSISKRVNESSDVTNKATLNTERGKAVLNHAKKLKEKYKPEQISEYLTLKDTVNGDIVKGADYLSNLKTSRGLSITILKNSDESIKVIEDAILNNNAIINTGTKHGDLVDLVKYNVDKNGKVSSKGEYTVIGYKLNTKNVKALKDLNNLKIDDSRLKDIVFQTADATKAADLAKYSELEEFFKESQGYSEDLSKLLGFTSFEENYYKHALSDNIEGGKFLKNVYAKLDMDNLDTLATLLGKNDKSLRGTFGSLPMTRTLRGGINRYNGLAPVFSTDLEAITSSALAKGVFDDSNFQSFVDLFINDNFKIKRWASNVDDLKRVMYLKDETGKFTGNLDNMQLVAPKFNESGRLVGFTKFDKLSDKGLEKALKNENTVLMPTEMIATLDHLTKKDAKLSNKMYNFMNKTFMLPFKLGTLVNPGFLVGNMNDAYLKQATALAQKHGTSVSEELTNVAVSIKNVIALNNQMSDIYTKYVEWCALNKKHIPDNWKNYTILTESKKAKNNFIEWLNMDENLTGVGTNVRKKAQLWMYINNFQETSVYKGKVRKNTQELEDITESTNNIIYENDKNIIERAFTGSGKYNPKDLTTWGLFTSNPVSHAVLESSAQIETIMRSSAVLNDLTHKYNSKDIMGILEGSESLEKSFRDRIKNGIEEEMRTVEDINRQQLEIDAMDALNLSSAANFNYEDTSGLIDTLSYGVPFPTFFLKNLAFWTNIIVENPQYIDNAISVQQGLWGSEDTSEDEFAAEAKGRGAIPVQFGGQKLSKFFKGIFKPSPLNSMFGAFNLINDPVEDMRYRLNPAIQLATSPLLPDEEVRYRPHNDNIYQRNVNKGDEEFNPLAYMFHTLNPYERQVKTFVRTPKKMEKGEAQLSDFLPSVFQPKF